MPSSSHDFFDNERPPIPVEERLDVARIPHASTHVESRRKYLILFLLTVFTTALAGGDWYLGFATPFGKLPANIAFIDLLVSGLWYGVPALLILGAHEFGHYFACRHYGIAVSLPYFLPIYVPLPVPQFGTLGAVIRIREPITKKRQLFDIGIAGPLAGFAVLVPVLLIGIDFSRVVAVPPDFRGGAEFGEPLLFQLVAWLRFGAVPDGYSVQLHPLGWAAWFGMLATALNLTPIGQLDGGHISYAVLGRKSGIVTLIAALGMVVLTMWSRGAYALWTIIVLVMLYMFGVHHPRALDEDVPLDRSRMWLALFALVMFALCFTPVPIEPLDAVTSAP